MTENRDDRLIVKPAPGMRIIHPYRRRPINEDGEDVTAHRGYFNRMLRTGDVVLVPPRAPAKPKGDK
jgi:hypothetical protein